MKRTLLFLPIIILLGRTVWGQAPVEKAYILQDVEIQGKRPDKLTAGEIKHLQVDRSLSGSTGTASDVFRQLPSVVTDIEGGIVYRGSSDPGLLINGIPYGWMEENSGDMLIQLPALFFNRISLSSMPSIEWVPDGDAGVMNLSSSSYTRNDSPLIVTLGAGFQERYNAGAIVNLHPGRFHIVGKYDYRREFRKRTFSKTTTNKSGTTAMNNNASARPDVHLTDLNVGYDLTANDQISVYGLYSLMDYSRYGKIHNSKLGTDGQFKPVMFRHRYNDQRQEAYAAEARWNHTFRHPQDRLSIRFNYNNFAYDEENEYQNENPASGAIVAEDNYDVRQDKHAYYWSALYGKMFENDWWLRVGYIGRFKHETYDAEGSKKTAEGWLPDAQKENVYTFDRRINLLYASVEKRWGAFLAEAGVQGEASWQKVAEQTGKSVFHVYPRIKLAYETDKSGVLSFNYIQRVIRPYGADLNPFLDRSDATHLRLGNPDLKNELIHSLEVSYLFTCADFQLTPSLYYRNKSNRIMEVAGENQQGETYWMKQNVGHSQALGFELSGTWRPFRVLTVGLSGNIFRDEIDGRTAGYDETKSMVCGDVKGCVNLNITPTTELQIDGFFVTDQLTPQGKIEHRSSVNAGLSHYFLDRRLRANISINNIFGGLKETTVIDTPDLKMTQVRNRDAQLTWLTLTYNL